MKLESQITNNHSSLIGNQLKRHSFNYNIFPDTLFMQNKANLGNEKMNINTTKTMSYEILRHLAGWKNKANSKPIKPKTNPIQTQFVERSKMNPFAWIIYAIGRNLTIVLIILLADFTALTRVWNA